MESRREHFVVCLRERRWTKAVELVPLEDHRELMLAR